MNDEPIKTTKRYRVEYVRDGTTYSQTAIISAATEQELAAKVDNLQLPRKQEKLPEVEVIPYPRITELNPSTTAALVAESVRERMHSLHTRTKNSEDDTFNFKDISVIQTASRPNYFSVKMLVSHDTNLIEQELRKGFRTVDDVNCSAEGAIPELDKDFPKQGYHEFVCNVQIYDNKVEARHVPEVIRVQCVVTWFSDFEGAYYDQTGKDIKGHDAKDEELLALCASGNGWIETIAHELGGQEFLDHRDLCEDGHKWIGTPKHYKLVEISKEEYEKLAPDPVIVE
jgi:hypothetical protein